MEQVSIRQRDPSESLCNRLQRQSTEWLQQLAGELWTDYNAHDPGVTITDMLNYALSELDYRLRFPLVDYLSSPSGVFDPGRFGLFLAPEVFPVNPVTPEDYRKLIADAVPDVDNLWIYPVEEEEWGRGWYDILLELRPDAGSGRRESVRKQVETVYHAHRNLGEGLRRVLFVERRPLVLQADIRVEADADPTQLMAAVYWETMQFFVAGIRYRRPEEMLAEGKTLDELLDGPVLTHWVVDNGSLLPQPCVYALSQLYRRLKDLAGVRNIRSLAFRDGDRIYTDLLTAPQADRSYTVLVPERREHTAVRLLMGDAVMEADFRHLPELLYARQARRYGNQTRTSDPSCFSSLPGSRALDIYTHESVQNDFPECYGINRMGVAPGASELRKAQARQLKAYLLLADEVFAGGLKELEQVPRLLDIGSDVPEEGIVPLTAPEVRWQELTEPEVSSGGGKGRGRREKEKWADMLDRIYGEDSNPAWLRAYNSYDDDPAELQERRFRFLRRIPEWGRDRFRAADLLRNAPGNVPGLKAYVSELLGFEMKEEHPVVNVFPLYNLKLVEDDRFYHFQEHLLSHHLLSEEEFREENMERIPLSDIEFTDSGYHALREKLPMLHYNLLFEGLFREGTRLESYRLLNLPLSPDRLLVFYHSRRGEWVNLGRFSSRGELIDAANLLRRFLVMLNRKSETLYLVEHLYLFTGENFTVTVVFPGWSVRMSDPRFRENCEELICSRLPAHLEVNFRWFNARQMWRFEQAYYDWRRELAAGGTGQGTAGKLKNVML